MPNDGKEKLLIESLYQKFATDPDGELWKRLKNNEGRGLEGAFFELALQVILKKTGCHITPHPTLPSSLDRPDFLIEPPEGDSFYLEASVVSGVTDEEYRDQRRLAAISDRVEAIQSDKFSIRATVDGTVKKDIKVSALVSQVRRWLDGLSEDAVRTYLLRPPPKFNKLRLKKPEEIVEPEEDIPCSPIPPEARSALVIPLEPDGELVVTVRPRRDPPPQKGISLHALMIRMRFQGSDGVARKVAKKARKYRGVDRPLVIAVSYREMSPIKFFAAERELFGFEGYGSDADGDGMGSGGFPGVLGPTSNTRVSGVLLCADLNAHHLSGSYAGYLANPWARNPLGELPLPCSLCGEDLWDRGLPLEP
ncbi:hypothetical protein, partial [Azospirillum argentinense]|uniref:hypothetical protein n=1 Tax=Azospirillum argentinense TaxID=2970906 RepID=UPI0032DFEF0B